MIQFSIFIRPVTGAIHPDLYKGFQNNCVIPRKIRGGRSLGGSEVSSVIPGHTSRQEDAKVHGAVGCEPGESRDREALMEGLAL